jgi:hypothetical protein
MSSACWLSRERFVRGLQFADPLGPPGHVAQFDQYRVLVREGPTLYPPLCGREILLDGDRVAGGGLGHTYG